jgi:hypothetical protein
MSWTTLTYAYLYHFEKIDQNIFSEDELKLFE